MAVFEVPREQPDEDEELPEGLIKEEFDGIDSFHQYLDGYYFSHLGNRDLHVIPGVTDSDKETLIERLSYLSRGWQIEQEYGVVTKLNHKTGGEDDPSGAYLAMEEDDSGYFIFYTNETKSGYVDDVLIKDLGRVPQTSKLHASPYRIESLVNEITERTPDGFPKHVNPPYSDEVILKRRRGSEIDSNREVDGKRTISYWGGDAGSVITDLRKEYGVLISSVRVKYPFESGDGTYLSFKIDNNGVLKLKKGNLTDMLSEVRPIIEETLDVKRAYDDVETTLVTLADGETEISQSTPALIKPRSDATEDSGFSAEEIEATIDAFTDRGYMPIDTYLEEDPLYYTTTVYHTQEKIYFDIRGDREALRIFPRAEQQELQTFFGVLDAVHENASSSAVAVSVSEVEEEQ